MYIREGLCYDDVLLVPKHSNVESRSNIDLSVKLNKYKYLHPIIPANMKTITESNMVDAVLESGGLAILHRFMPLDEQVKICKFFINEDEPENANQLAFSVGVKEEDKEAVSYLYKNGARIFCVDVAHGDSEFCFNMTKWIRMVYPDVFIIAGNVATGDGAKSLWDAGADAVKVGVGPGSLCTTRIETGNGVPQLSALIDVYGVRKVLRDHQEINGLNREFYIIADGGIKNAGDIVKALCFSDMVMVGNVFAGCEETPGNILSIDGKQYKEYVGSSTHKTNHIEGVAAIVPAKGRFKDILTKLLEGIRSGCSYQGSYNLNMLKRNPEFVKITSAGLRESHPHDVILK